MYFELSQQLLSICRFVNSFKFWLNCDDWYVVLVTIWHAGCENTLVANMRHQIIKLTLQGKKSWILDRREHCFAWNIQWFRVRRINVNGINDFFTVKKIRACEREFKILSVSIEKQHINELIIIWLTTLTLDSTTFVEIIEISRKIGKILGFEHIDFGLVTASWYVLKRLFMINNKKINSFLIIYIFTFYFTISVNFFQYPKINFNEVQNIEKLRYN